jgi:hypothetical protein
MTPTASVHRAATGLLSALAVAACASLPAPPADPRALELARFEATVRGDPAALAPLLAADLRYCHSTAVCETREQFLESLRSGQRRYTSMTPLELTPRRIGDVLLIGGTVDVEVVAAGATQRMRLVYTDAYAVRDGRWQLVAWHSTRVP